MPGPAGTALIGESVEGAGVWGDPQKTTVWAGGWEEERWMFSPFRVLAATDRLMRRAALRRQAEPTVDRIQVHVLPEQVAEPFQLRRMVEAGVFGHLTQRRHSLQRV